MAPVLLSFGPITLYSLSLFLLFSWITFSFLFWKSLRNQAISEEKIFDMTFYATLSAIIGARVLYILQHLGDFASPLQYAALWVVPGLSFYGALIAIVFTLLFLSKKFQIRTSIVFDGVASSLPAAMLVGTIGSFLDGSVIGIETGINWGVRYVGYDTLRHPVQLYQFAGLVIVMLVVHYLSTMGRRKKWPYGIAASWFILLSSGILFIIEYFVDGGIYFFTLTVQQWILVAFFAESVGLVYVAGGGREFIRKQQDTLKGVIHERKKPRPEILQTNPGEGTKED